jgi:membrane protease YdiL (CAAX protease family)
VGRRYLDLARLGRNSPGRYLAALGLIFFFWFGLGFAVMALALTFRGTARALGGAAAVRFLEYVALNLSFVTFLIGILLAVRWIHQRSPRTLITPYSRVDWRRVAQGFVVWLVLAALASLVEALLFPGRYELSFNLPLFLAMAPVVLLLTPLQTSSEELFLRGYLLQAFGLRTRNPIALALITATVFTLPHLGNPEVGAGIGWLVVASYFGIGVLLALVTLADDSLELALGAHAANNLYSALVANYVVSALSTESIFVVKEIDAVYGDLSLLAMAVVFWLLVFRVLKRSVPAEPS